MMMRRVARVMTAVGAGVLLLSAGARAAAPVPANGGERAERIAAVFRPFQTDRAALSPDGRHLAYELRRDGRLFLVLVDIETKRAVELPLTEDRAIPVSGISEKVPARLTYLAWANPDRVVATVQDEVLVAADADGSDFRILMDSKKLEWTVRAPRERGLAYRANPDLLPGYDVSDPTFTRRGVDRGLTLERQMDAARWDATLSPGGVMPTQDDPFGRAEPTVLSTHTGLNDPAQDDLFNSGEGAGVLPTWRPFVVDLLEDDPEHVLVEVRGRAGPWDDGPLLGDVPAINAFNVVTGLTRIDVRTGKVKDMTGDPSTSRIVADRSARPRLWLRHFSTERTFLVARGPRGKAGDLDELLVPAGLAPSRVTPETYFEPRTIPLGFGYDPNVLYLASNQGRDTFGIYALDLTAGRPTELAIEHPELDLADFNEAIADDVLVFDRHQRRLVGVRIEDLRRGTRWFDEELAALQASLDAMAPGIDFEILEWDRDRTRFLVLAANRSEPGAYYVFERKSGVLNEYVRRAPWIREELANTSTPFVYRTPSGTTLRGYFTYPRDRRIEPVPVLVYCHDGPWSRDRPGYDRGTQALAAMGFAVLQVNYRGSSGFGRAHLQALRRADEQVAIEDLLAAVEWVQQTHAVSRRRIAILGNGYGGYLALRALQLHPDRFRCAVGINAPANFETWLNYPYQPVAFARDVRKAFFPLESERLQAASLTHRPSDFQQPVLIVQAEGDTVVPESQGRALRRALQGEAQHDPEYFRLRSEGHSRWLPGSYVQVFERLETFFRENIFEYVVEAGEATVIEK